MTKHQSIRLDEDIRTRLADMRAAMSARTGGLEIDFSKSLRVVLLRGLQILEQELGIGGLDQQTEPK